MFNEAPVPATTVDPVPSELLAILDLFAADLGGVAFPGVDAARLGQHADEVRARARDVERAQAALDSALAALGERTAALAALAARGLAYARIYAADDAELAARLAELDAGDRPSAPRALAPTRAPLHRRRRKAEPPELPLGDVATPAEAAASDS
ncbi:MAG TPA: hypothetical protein VK698_28015 [Kofleriaceae bacterium]|nr:hypothetical protein [Kofleriaceae bacterium]